MDDYALLKFFVELGANAKIFDQYNTKDIGKLEKILVFKTKGKIHTKDARHVIVYSKSDAIYFFTGDRGLQDAINEFQFLLKDMLKKNIKVIPLRI